MSLRFPAKFSDRCAASLPNLSVNFNCWVSFFHDATLLGVQSVSSTVKAFSIAVNLAVDRLCELVYVVMLLIVTLFMHKSTSKMKKKLVSLLGVVLFLPQPEIVSLFTGSRKYCIRQHL